MNTRVQFSAAEGRHAAFESVLFSQGPTGIATATYRRNQVLFAQGEKADSVLYLHQGRAKVTVLSPAGKEAIIALLEPGDFCGEGCLADQTLRATSVVALTDCDIVRIEKIAMMRLLHEESAVCETFNRYLLARNIRVESDLVSQRFNSSEQRLARLLLTLAKFEKEGASERIVPSISQETLAEMIGTTRSRVSYFMNKFRDQGFIAYNGHLEVRSSLLSVVLTDHRDPSRR
jgi:CRP/FNR family cyclic AMP-dependent transcriptional regulator